MRRSHAIALILVTDAVITAAAVRYCDNYVTPKETALGISAAVLLYFTAGAAILRGKRPRLPLGVSGVFLCLWIATQIAAAAVSSHPAFSLNELRLPVLYLLIYLSVRWCDAGDGREGYNALFVLTIAAALFSAHGVLQYFGADFLPNWSRYAKSDVSQLTVYSLFGNSNLLGDFLAAALPISAAGFLLGAESKRNKILAGCSTVLISAALVMTGSRAAFAAAAAGIMALSIWRISAAGKKSPLLVYIGAAAAVVALIAAVTFAVPGKMKSVPMRIVYWKAAGAMFKERPLLGGGAGRFRLEYMDFQRQYFKSPHPKETELIAQIEKPRHPHNEYLNELADNGLFGALFLILTIGSGIALGFRPPPRGSMVSAAWAASLTALAVSSFFSFPLRIPTTGFLFPAALAIIDDRAVPDIRKQNFTPFPDTFIWNSAKWIALIAVLCLSIAIVYVQMIPLESNIYRADAKRMIKAGFTENALDYTAKALKLTPNDGETLFTAGSIYLATGQAETALPYLQKAKKVSSDPNLVFNLGIAYAETGSLKNAIREMTSVAEASPANPKPKLFLAEYYERSGALKKSCEELAAAHSLAPDNNAIVHAAAAAGTRPACPYALADWFKKK